MMRKISVAMSVAATFAAVAGGVGSAAAAEPAAAGWCTPYTWADPDSAPVKQLHVRVDGCGGLEGRPVKVTLTNGSELDCKPLDAGNHTSWHVIASADYRTMAWC